MTDIDTQHHTDQERQTISVVIADDHPIVRKGINDELSRESDIDVIGQAVDGDGAMELSALLQPDVLVLDINMPGMKAVEIIHATRKLRKVPNVLIVSAYGDTEIVLAMLKAGAIGYLLKDEEPTTIIDAVRSVAAGKTWFSTSVASSVVLSSIRDDSDLKISEITDREEEILILVALGRDNDEISSSLSITVGTVKNHISSIYDKLGVRSRAEAVTWAWQRGLVKRESDTFK
jgi:DNA-binding NarL/FixJ family response regulator